MAKTSKLPTSGSKDKPATVVDRGLEWHERYKNNPKLQALVGIIDPIFFGGALGLAERIAESKISKIKRERLEYLFQCLERGEVEITPDLIENEDFIHCWHVTEKAVSRTRRKEKIELFAQLFQSALETGKMSGAEQYELFVDILDELTLDEVKLLLCIEKYEELYYTDGRFDDKRGKVKFENQLLKQVNDMLRWEIDDNSLLGMVIRLNRTGLYSMMGWRLGPAKDCRLTGLYFDFKELVLKTRSEIDLKENC